MSESVGAGVSGSGSAVEAAAGGGAEVVLTTPEAYAAAYEARLRDPDTGGGDASGEHDVCESSVACSGGSSGGDGAMVRRYRVSGLCGRIVRGTNPEHFKRLHMEPWSYKRLVFVAAPEAMEALLRTRSEYDTLVQVGLSPTWIAARLKETDLLFKLAVFPEVDADGKQLCYPADWDNLFLLIDKFYPEVSAVLRKYESELRSKPYVEIDPAGRIREVSEMTYTERNVHDEYMIVHRLAKIEEPTLYHCRAFLYHNLGLNYLFTGDGWTKNMDGERTEREFFVPNLLYADMPGHCLIDLKIQLPEGVDAAEEE